MSIWITDPVNGLPSVSLTLLVITFGAVVIAGGLQMAGVVESTSLFSEIFYSSVALYFGRRLNIGNKQFTADKAEAITEKVSNE